MMGLIGILLNKRSAGIERVQADLSGFFTVASKLDIFETSVNNFVAQTDHIDFVRVHELYTDYCEDLSANIAQCKNAIELILVETTRVGVLGTLNFEAECKQFFAYIRQLIPDAPVDWDIVLADLGFIQDSLNKLVQDLTLSVQEAYVTLYNIRHLRDVLVKFTETPRIDGYAECLLVLKKWINLLTFLERSIPAGALEIQRGLEVVNELADAHSINQDV